MRRWWVRLIAAIVVVVLLLVGAVFLLTNSNWGRERVRRYVEGLIQRNSHGLVHIGKVTGICSMDSPFTTSSSPTPHVPPSSKSTRHGRATV